MITPVDFEIYDEDGFIALVNTNSYQSFVDEDWELDQLLGHFVKQMNRDALLVWATAPGGGLWKITVTDKPSAEAAFREVEKTVDVTKGKLYLINYTDLTMAAQFKDEVLPAKDNADFFVELPKGKYSVTVRQMFNPDDYDYKADNTFELVIKPCTESTSAKAVYWWDM